MYNKLPTKVNSFDTSGFVLKTKYDTDKSDLEKKVSDAEKEIEKKINAHDHDKYIVTSEFNKLTTKSFAARLAQANLVTKTYFDAKLTSLNKKN